MSRVAYLDCSAGISGDMVLAALLDAGAPRVALERVIDGLGLPGVRIDVEPAIRGGVAATRIVVRVAATGGEPERPMRELIGLLEAADLPGTVRSHALEALRRLASVEARIHGVDPQDLIVHELGGDDTLVDLCGAFMLFEAMGIDRVVCSPLPYARSRTTSLHGAIPAPGPAVLGLLEGAPLVGVEAEDELVTPTGAAVVAQIAHSWGELPPMTLEAVGYGAGGRDPADRANVLRIVIGTPSQPSTGTELVLLEANLDDLVPELVPDALERCMSAGALDVWTVPAMMKKGRPGIVVGALARPQHERAVAASLLVHTSTLGVRVTPMRRYELEREIREVKVQGYAIRVKVGMLEERVVNIAPEHDDCAAVASLTGVSVKRIWAAAMAAAEPMAEPIAGAGEPLRRHP